jgi:hypothetical protein
MIIFLNKSVMAYIVRLKAIASSAPRLIDLESALEKIQEGLYDDERNK